MKTSVRITLAVAVLAGLAVAPAQAAGDQEAADGTAEASVLRTRLDVGLLDRSVHVPLRASLNEVSAEEGGGTERKTALTARLDGVENGEPFSVLRASVAEAEAGRDDDRAWGEARLGDAKVYVPGLPLRSVVELEAVTSRVECPAGKRARAEVDVPGAVKVLGRKVTLKAEGPTVVTVDGVGEVRLELSGTQSTSSTAAASALDVAVAVDPLDLGVAEVSGTLTVAEAECTAPRPGDVSTQTEQQSAVPEEPAPETELAETGGGDSSHPYVVGGGVLLVAAGGAAVFAVRRRGARGN